MIPVHYTQVEKHPLTQILAGGAVLDHVPQFDGTNYAAQYPVAALNAGSLLGRVSEINVTGSGGLATIAGKRLTINVDKGVNARSTYPSVGSYQAVSNVDFGAGFITSIGGGTVTVSTSAATPNIGLSNGGVGVGVIVSPGANSSFVLRSILQGSGITVAQVGDNIQISSVAAGGLVGTNGNGLTVTSNTVALALATTGHAGAVAQLSGTGTDYFAGDGTYKPLPTNGVSSFNMATGAVQLVNGTNTTVVSLGGGQFRVDAATGGGGAVTSVTSGNGTVLQVTPTTGGVVVTPIGLTGTISPAWNSTTRQLTLPLITQSGGITASTSAVQYDLSSAISNTVEVRDEGIVVGQAMVLNFVGAGVSVTTGVGYEINIPGGGGGISGISINGGGSYTNISFTGAGVSVSGGIVTISGGGGGGLVGTSGNGLTVGTDNVSLAIATTSSAGAMPVLSGVSTQHLTGAGTWVNTPTGLPSGTTGQTLRHDGSGWSASSAIYNNPSGIAGIEASSTASINGALVEINAQLSSGAVNIGRNSLANSIGLIRMEATKIGIFGQNPIVKQSLPADATDLASAITLLNALKHAEINYGWY